MPFVYFSQMTERQGQDHGGKSMRDIPWRKMKCGNMAAEQVKLNGSLRKV